MTKNRKIFERVIIEDFASEARCISRVDGKVLFTEFTAPGDVVDLKITRNKKTYFEAIPVKFHAYGKNRVKPFCIHFGECGGCKWQHIPYQDQLDFKRRQVIDQFERIGKFPFPAVNNTLGSSETQYYRNKLEFTFSDRRWLTQEEIEMGKNLDRNGLGFHRASQFDKIIDIEECFLQPDPSNRIRQELKFFARKENIPFYNLLEHTGFLRNLIIRTSNTGDVMVILQVAYTDKPLIEKSMNFLRNNFKEITSLNYVVNAKRNETFFDLEVINVHGDPFIIEEIEGLKFRIGPKSFFQTNSRQVYELLKIVRESGKLNKSHIVYDLYSGTGTIAIFISEQVKRVIGIESVEAAVKDARMNAEINGIVNTAFETGDIKDLITKEFVEVNGNPDIIITDPPRAGMHSEVVSAILRLAPVRIVYVSCNPATQARDISLLSKDYKVKIVQPVDMFPHTHHIENVVMLEKI